MFIAYTPESALGKAQSIKKSSSKKLSPFNRTLVYTFIFLMQIRLATSQCDKIHRTNNEKIYCDVCDNFFFACTVVSTGNSSAANSQSLNYNSCQTQCCDRNYYEYTSLSMCTNIYNQSQTTLGLSTILIIVFFSVPLLICICITIKTCYNNRMHQAIINRNREQLAVNLSEFKIDELGPYYLNRGENCSICLEDSCHIRTRCGHHYHSACLLAWIHKKESCPLCVGETFNPILLYCTNCFKIITMQNIMQGMSDDLNEFWGTADTIKCEACDKKKADQISIEDIDETSKNMKKQNLQVDKKVGQSLQNIRQNENG